MVEETGLAPLAPSSALTGTGIGQLNMKRKQRYEDDFEFVP